MSTSDPRQSQPAKKPGVCYVKTVDGIELPVVDITHPAFAIQEPTAAEKETLIKKSEADMQKFNRMPAFMQRIFLWVFSRQSVLMRGLLGAKGTYLSGMNTYLLKLGADNLQAPYGKPLDKVIAASLPTISTRLRLADMANFTADAVAPLLAQRPNQPFFLINIAGGPCSDSLNCLILLYKKHPELLKGRAISVHVLDKESAAPTFAKSALEALQSPRAVLDGCAATLDYARYNWHDSAILKNYLTDLNPGNGIVLVTAEGGLFDYGNDEDIIANLKILASMTPPDAILAGTFTPPRRAGVGMANVGGATTIARSLENFTTLANQGGWDIVKASDRLINFVVRMSKRS